MEWNYSPLEQLASDHIEIDVRASTEAVDRLLKVAQSAQTATPSPQAPPAAAAPQARVTQNGLQKNVMGEIVNSLSALSNALKSIQPVLNQKEKLHQTVVQNFTRARNMIVNLQSKPEFSKYPFMRAAAQWLQQFNKTVNTKAAQPAATAKLIDDFLKNYGSMADKNRRQNPPSMKNMPFSGPIKKPIASANGHFLKVADNEALWEWKLS